VAPRLRRESLVENPKQFFAMIQPIDASHQIGTSRDIWASQDIAKQARKDLVVPAMQVKGMRLYTSLTHRSDPGAPEKCLHSRT
jgi:hypothetical protein